jgi:hypothetical protein
MDCGSESAFTASSAIKMPVITDRRVGRTLKTSGFTMLAPHFLDCCPLLDRNIQLPSRRSRRLLTSSY